MFTPGPSQETPENKNRKKPSELIDEIVQALHSTLNNTTLLSKLTPSEKDTAIINLLKLSLPSSVVVWLEKCEEAGTISFSKRNGMSTDVVKSLRYLDSTEWKLLEQFFSLKNITSCLVDQASLKFSSKKNKIIEIFLTKITIQKIEAEHNEPTLLSIKEKLSAIIESEIRKRAQNKSPNNKTDATTKKTHANQVLSHAANQHQALFHAPIFNNIPGMQSSDHLTEKSEFSESMQHASIDDKSDRSREVKHSNAIKKKQAVKNRTKAESLLSGSEDDADAKQSTTSAARKKK